jgi:urease accessory protein
MALGGVLGIAEVPLPGVEILIALSGIVLGLMVVLKAEPPIWAAAVIVGTFAVFHGYAHGTELPKSATPLAYSLGFVISTGLIHIGGISFGLLTKWPKGLIAVRVLGGGIVLVGLYFLKSAFTG